MMVVLSTELDDCGAQKVGDCAAACVRTEGIEMLQCLRQFCGMDGRLPASELCPFVCSSISPEDVNGCIQHYCPEKSEQEDEESKGYKEKREW